MCLNFVRIVINHQENVNNLVNLYIAFLLKMFYNIGTINFGKEVFIMKLRKIFAGMSALAVAATMAVNASAVELAEGVQEGHAYLGFADSEWIVAGWGKGDDKIKIAEIEDAPEITGDGTYTIKVDISGGVDVGDTDPYDVTTGIACMGVNLWGEQFIDSENELPKFTVTVDSFKADGQDITITGVPLVNLEDDGVRFNLYNEWGQAKFDETKTTCADPDKGTNTVVDISEIGDWSTLEVTFTISGLGSGEADPEPETPAPADPEPETPAPATDPAPAATGASAGLALAGLALAGAAVVITKRK